MTNPDVIHGPAVITNGPAKINGFAFARLGDGGEDQPLVFIPPPVCIAHLVTSADIGRRVTLSAHRTERGYEADRVTFVDVSAHVDDYDDLDDFELTQERRIKRLEDLVGALMGRRADG